ncbi:MAG: putative pre-16S rRNA nuclease [Dehalococcoidia bacterium]|nr:MAG: putative pre-16S rRNA nuclease [Dehalococcoidia bacterium]
MGDRRIGLAVSDELGVIATPLAVLPAAGRKVDIPAIVALAEREGVAGIVVGLPIRDDGARTEQTDKAERFARRLAAATSLPVRLHDERYTTWEAQQRRAGRRRGGPDDAEAAAVLLESFLADLHFRDAGD